MSGLADPGVDLFRRVRIEQTHQPVAVVLVEHGRCGEDTVAGAAAGVAIDVDAHGHHVTGRR